MFEKIVIVFNEGRRDDFFATICSCYTITVKSPLLAALELKTPLNCSRSHFFKLPNILEAALKHKPQLT